MDAFLASGWTLDAGGVVARCICSQLCRAEYRFTTCTVNVRVRHCLNITTSMFDHDAMPGCWCLLTSDCQVCRLAAAMWSWSRLRYRLQNRLQMLRSPKMKMFGRMWWGMRRSRRHRRASGPAGRMTGTMRSIPLRALLAAAAAAALPATRVAKAMLAKAVVAEVPFRGGYGGGHYDSEHSRMQVFEADHRLQVAYMIEADDRLQIGGDECLIVQLAAHRFGQQFEFAIVSNT